MDEKREILLKLAECVEKGKADIDSPYPPELKGQKGASELTAEALEINISPGDILNDSLMVAMNNIGEKFSQGKAFIPNLLIAAKAMNASMEHLKPFFESGEVKHRGTLIIGTVAGDLHDIGKNLVKMVMKGDGWNVVDLGVDVSAETFTNAVVENPGSVVGLSALLTTTMLNMEGTVKSIRGKSSDTKIFIGGAPVSQQFCDKIGADGYYPDPHSLVQHFH
jgi:methanogenic corrinoid protein MtbC1